MKSQILRFIYLFTGLKTSFLIPHWNCNHTGICLNSPRTAIFPQSWNSCYRHQSLTEARTIHLGSLLVSKKAAALNLMQKVTELDTFLHLLVQGQTSLLAQVKSPGGPWLSAKQSFRNKRKRILLVFQMRETCYFETDKREREREGGLAALIPIPKDTCQEGYPPLI